MGRGPSSTAGGLRVKQPALGSSPGSVGLQGSPWARGARVASPPPVCSTVVAAEEGDGASSTLRLTEAAAKAALMRGSRAGGVGGVGSGKSSAGLANPTLSWERRKHLLLPVNRVVLIWKLLVGKIKCGKSRIHRSCFALLPAMFFFACEPVWNKTRGCYFTCAFSLCIDPACSAGEALPKVPKPAAFGYNRSSRFYFFS